MKLRFSKIALIVGLVVCVVFGFSFNWLDKHYIVPIMMYHYVDYQGHSKATTTSPERFAKHMDYLKRHNYNVISLDQLVEAIINDRRLPRNSVVITFDDGYDDNYLYAYQTLKRYNFPATFFVAGAKIGGDQYMTWNQLREMAQNGYEIGSHTWNHQYLPQKDRGLQIKEIFEGKKSLEKRLGQPVKLFCYPSGGFSEQVKQLTKQAGFIAAVTTNRGFDRSNQDIFELKRIRFSDQDDISLYLWAKLSGHYNMFRKTKKPY